MIEKQVIVTWSKPEEKLPPNGMMVVATISGKLKGEDVEYEHAFAVMEYLEDSGWESSDGFLFDSLTVHAWADLEPYGTRDGEVIG